MYCPRCHNIGYTRCHDAPDEEERCHVCKGQSRFANDGLTVNKVHEIQMHFNQKTILPETFDLFCKQVIALIEKKK